MYTLQLVQVCDISSQSIAFFFLTLVHSGHISNVFLFLYTHNNDSDTMLGTLHTPPCHHSFQGVCRCSTPQWLQTFFQIFFHVGHGGKVKVFPHRDNSPGGYACSLVCRLLHEDHHQTPIQQQKLLQKHRSPHSLPAGEQEPFQL